MNFEFDIDQQAVLEVAEEFARRELAPHIDEMEEKDCLPAGFFKRAGQMGITGIAFSEEYGGAGQSHVTLMAAFAKIAEVSPGPVISLTTTLAGMEIINKNGTPEQKAKYLRACVDGDMVAGMAFTEPGTGSDPKQLTLTATEDGDDILLNGVKRFITNAAYPGPLIVYAKDADTGRCSAYIVDKLCEGYSLSTAWEKVGFRGSPIYDVFLDNVRIPKSNLVGEKGTGFAILLSESSVGKMSHGAAILGICEASKNLAIKYAKEKLHRGQPITKFQAIQLKIARICEKTESVKWMLYRCAELADKSTESEEFKAYAALMKAYMADTVPEVGMMAMNVMGAYAPMKEYGIERYMRDAITEPQVEVVSDVQRVIAAAYYINHAKA